MYIPLPLIFSLTKQYVTGRQHNWHVFCYVSRYNEISILVCLKNAIAWKYFGLNQAGYRRIENMDNKPLIPIQHLVIHLCATAVLWGVIFKLIF